MRHRRDALGTARETVVEVLEMKPNWSTAPDFARYLAMDKDGAWWWFSHKPRAGTSGWWLLSRGIGLRASVGDWRDTLEERPVHNEHEEEGME